MSLISTGSHLSMFPPMLPFATCDPPLAPQKVGPQKASGLPAARWRTSDDDEAPLLEAEMSMQAHTNIEDRRAPGVQRVALDAVVEICGQDADIPPFEARSREVSGRGMLVKSEYLPPERAPLVLRFEHRGREVVVEGLVAWRREAEQGGEFGIRFTALDSKSVVVLKELCAAPETPARTARLPDAQESLFEELPDESNPPPTFCTKRGAAMKLHIDGLAAPMKARVVEGSAHRVRVGSQLEFLTLGRPLQLEDLSNSHKQSAFIHSVSVEIDAETHVPQLVVTLRCAEDSTPEPTVVTAKGNASDDEEEFSDEKTSPSRKRTWAAAPKKPTSREPVLDEDEEEDDDMDAAERLLKGRFAVWATSASRGVQAMSDRVATAAQDAARLVRDFKPTRRTGKVSTRSVRPSPSGRAMQSTRVPRPRSVTLPSTTLPPGSAAPAASDNRGKSRSLRPRSKQAAVSSRRSKQLIGGGVAAGCLVLGTYLWSGGGSPAFEDQDAPALAAGTPQPLADEAPTARRKTLDTEAEMEPETHGIVANVPLFGPTKMATTEPIAEGATAKASGAVDEVSLSKDESFSDRVVDLPKEVRAQREFQVGRMHLPVIHRLRLDTEAETLQGEQTPTGFSVLIPGRKVMESGSAIASRDDRITNVRVQNTPAGAKITFRFGKDVPGYKARLRNDYIEFFINSPE